MKRKRTALKLHPAVMLRTLRRLVFVLLIPLLEQLLTFEFSSLRLIAGETVALGGLMALSLIEFRRSSVEICGDRLIVRRGWLLHRQREIPFSQISSLIVEQTVFLSLTGGARVRMDTNAGGRCKADSTLILQRSSLPLLYRAAGLKPQNKGGRFFRSGIHSVALMAAFTSSATTGLLFAAPVFSRAAKLLGQGLADRLYGTFSVLADRIDQLAGPFSGAAALLLLTGWAVSFVMSVFRNGNFSVRRSGTRVGITTGVLGQRRVLFDERSVQALIIRQTPLMRLLRLYTAQVSLPGYGKARGETAALAPCADRCTVNKLTDRVLPGFSVGAVDAGSRKPVALHPIAVSQPMAVGPTLSGFIGLALFIVFVLALRGQGAFVQLLLLVAAVAGLLVLLRLGALRHARQYGGVTLGSKMVEMTTCSRLSVLTVRIPVTFVGHVSVSCIGRQATRCKMRLLLRGESGRGFLLRGLSRGEAQRMAETLCRMTDKNLSKPTK